MKAHIESVLKRLYEQAQLCMKEKLPRMKRDPAYLEKILPLQERIEAILALIEEWVSSLENGTFQLIEPIIERTGLSKRMVHDILKSTFDEIRKLKTWIIWEWKGRAVFDAFESWGENGPDILFTTQGLTIYWMPGNLPGPSLISLIEAIVSGGPFLMRVSRHEPYLASSFWTELCENVPEFEKIGDVVWWPSDHDDMTRSILSHAQTCVAYGFDATLDHLRKYVPGRTRWLPYPHRFSCILVLEQNLNMLEERVWNDIALDTILYHQLGCMSPQNVYFVGLEFGDLKKAGEQLARAFERLTEKYPMSLSDDQAMRIHSFLTRWIFEKNVEVFSGKNIQWNILISDDPTPIFSCGYRNLILKHVPDLEMFEREVFKISDHLQTLGYIGTLPESLFIRLARLGFKRFCPAGRMQTPPFAGCHDGHPRLLDKLVWVQLERK